jgi:hypothetical protein
MHNRRMCRVGVVEPYGWSPWGELSAILRVEGPFPRRVVGGVSLCSFQVVGCAELFVDELEKLGSWAVEEVTKPHSASAVAYRIFTDLRKSPSHFPHPHPSSLRLSSMIDS